MKKLILLIILFSFYSCELELDKANPIENLVITTGSTQEIGTFSCKVQGTITTNEFNGVDNYGHCWSLQNSPIVDDASTSFGKFKGEKSFESNINNLSVNTSYYVRAYAVANETISYGAEIEVETIWAGDVPLVQTGGANFITTSSATIQGEIVEQGMSSVTKYGHYWSTSPGVSSSNYDDKSEFSGGNTIDTFPTILTNLSQETSYYYRAYAVNNQGTGYGPENSFSTTDGRPSVSTIEVSEITSSSALAEGEIIGEGDAPITKHGHCWSTSALPTINDLKTENPGGSPGMIFSSNLTNLSPVSDYYVRSYAQNIHGTAYGDEILFSTNNGLAVVITGSHDITGSLVSLHGQIIEIGDGIIEHGHYWSTSSGVSSSNYDDKSELGSESNTVSFTTPDISLNPNTTYYYMAYAVTAVGTRMGIEKTLSTGSPWTNIGQLSGITYNNNAMLVLSSNNVWIVGTDVWNWDGSVWNTISSPSSNNLVAVHGTSLNNIWVLDDNNGIFNWNGSSWNQCTSPSISNLKDILVFGNTIIVAGGNYGPKLAFSSNGGASWLLESPTCTSSQNCHNFRDMDGTSPNNIWVAAGSTTNNGEQGVYQYNGVSWDHQQLYNIQCLSVINTTSGFSTSHGDIGNWSCSALEYFSGSWNYMNLPTSASSYWGYTPISAISANNMWFGSDKIYKYNGNTWNEETGSIGDEVKIIQMLNASEGFAVTGNGTLLRRQ